MTTASRPELPATAGAAPSTPSRSPGVSPPSGALRVLGAGLAVGAAVYGVCWLFFEGATGGGFVIDLSGIALQLGVFCLLVALWITRGTGTGRVGRGLLVVEAVILGIATIQSAFAAAAGGGEWGTVATVLDPSWPLSMLGMVVVGVTVAVVGRWRGVLRVWAPFACSWLLIGAAAVPLGDVVGPVVAGVHFLVGYAVLGVLLAVRPDLTSRA
ncbi:hypothetical protein EV188_11396 [Actinomycetospora succinea]|uniref:DUF4386 family protein n=1 Tax=Actinomycetospora succinea TaxID=663603 RepID=A0A4R6UKF8_9PSEU|nr:hypothetical protein [Actinomycetospora succinea]TDQ47351.1 hypothetical protein EV188_11396 [Actinomycetospora succinea]